MTLVKSLYSGNPEGIQTYGLASARYSGYVTCKCYSSESNAYAGDPTFELLLHAECMSAIHWGSHVEAPNSNSLICLNGSFLECLPPASEVWV